MPHRAFTIEEVAEYLHISLADVERLVQRDEIPHRTRGGRTLFQRGEIDAWASQRIIGMPDKRLDAYHARSTAGAREVFQHDALMPELLQPGYIDLALPSKTKASVIRDMVALAAKTGRVFDPREFLTSVQKREELCPTAMPGGLALLHAREHQPFRFEGSFLVIGRTVQAVPFSAPDGRPTQLFFLICCEDERIHLHTLARLCLLVLKTDVVNQLFATEDPAVAFEAVIAAEKAVLPEPGASTSG
ncbi:PTS sugar transporter subunit IIA [Opitutus terrae]|uniref:Putative PTS IIA-like nitrogen-regulatory protein PtsN n=1 Tax=Opitutus terrae (strain DSM 11246 / JCM 15787 / PB90-1) TaxID=452637 RepID=B1ZPQ8_OPITP|nr:PTS sugar transporter subunit IIA [Opitutus terrae]ACB75511.1 putative PTS IIA-like nitrogen-regulatory protein PtsN [Opitutus terrae PB90-1]